MIVSDDVQVIESPYGYVEFRRAGRSVWRTGFYRLRDIPDDILLKTLARLG